MAKIEVQVEVLSGKLRIASDTYTHGEWTEHPGNPIPIDDTATGELVLTHTGQGNSAVHVVVDSRLVATLKGDDGGFKQLRLQLAELRKL